MLLLLDIRPLTLVKTRSPGISLFPYFKIITNLQFVSNNIK
jgi:hypothetical protein